MKTAPFVFVAALALLLICVGASSSYRYCKSITPKFYNTSTISSSEETTLRYWIRWKNKMPRFGLYLDYVFPFSSTTE